MDENTYQRYRTWMWRRIFKRVGIPVSLLTVFILGRCSVTIPECEICPPVVVCPEPVVCETADDDYENGEDDPSYSPDETDNPDLSNGDDYETPSAPPVVQWDQP